MDDISRKQTEIKLVYAGYLLAWFCCLFMIYSMNRPQRSVSSCVLVGFILATVCVIGRGFVLRKTLFQRSSEALPGNVGNAIRRWRGAHFIGFSWAMNLTIFGVVLKFLGSSWYLAGIFFGLSLGFLLLWRPRVAATGGRGGVAPPRPMVESLTFKF